MSNLRGFDFQTCFFESYVFFFFESYYVGIKKQIPPDQKIPPPTPPKTKI
jgi:hypothetical protein